MPLYLYGQSALDVTRYLRSTEGGTIPGRFTRPKRLGNAIHNHRQINQLNHSAQLMLSHVRGPIHALVPNRNMSNKSTRLVTHVWTHDIPGGAYLNLGNEIYLPTPAFLIQQMATLLDEIDLVLLGLELCGFYSKWKYPIKKVRPTVDDEFKECTFKLEPATSIAKMRQFIARRKGERGYSASKHCLQRVLDNSASPMESAVYLLLCLPRRLGGYALPAPMLNAEVTVSTSTSTTKRFPDLYWHASALDVEYDSDSDHSGQWSRYRDSRRIVELAAERITVLPLTRKQLMNTDEFAAFATSVRRNLGVRARTLDTNWHAQHLDLRERLLDDHANERATV